jgi:hypothetical protein
VSQVSLSIEDDYGDTLEVHAHASEVEFTCITEDHEVVVALDGEDVDELIAWLATWKERQSA